MMLKNKKQIGCERRKIQRFSAKFKRALYGFRRVKTDVTQRATSSQNEY